MAKEFKLPELGENIQTADILKIMVSQGDNVKEDQTILEIETDKATVEVPSDISGKVKEVLVKQGDKVKVGQVIIVFEEESEVTGSTVNKNSKDAIKEAESSSREVTKEPARKPAEEHPEKPAVKAKKEQVHTKQEGKTVKFKLPELGENIESATVLNIKVKEGDKIETDQILLEIETDKATVEVPSDIAGVIKSVHIKSGEKAKVGQEIFTIETEGKAEEKIEAESEEKPEEDIKPVEQPSKAEVKDDKKAVDEKSKDYIEARPPSDPTKIAPAAPTVRRFAREIGVDINKVTGKGPGGRISIADVKEYARLQNESAEQTKSTGLPGIFQEQLPDFKKWGEVEKKEMSNIRRKTAEHLSFAWATIPHVTQFDKADITELEKLRKTYSSKAEEAGAKLTITAILIKIITSALKAFPQFNSSIDMASSTVIYKKYFNVGVAVDTEFGLLVPVIKNADKKNIIDLSIEMNQLAEKARNKKLSIDEMQGGSFTITNLGGIGGTYFTPIVNAPEVAILGVSRGNYEQVYIDGKFETRLMLPLSLSYDHRIIDGADAIRFLRWVIGAIQQPFLLALEG